jgi:hypothetical protein
LRIVAICFSAFFMLVVIGAAGVVYVFSHYSQGLPEYTQDRKSVV